MKNKKGFTLIELLSILAILGVLATITVPIINNVIKKAKDEADHKSIEQYIVAAKNYYAESISDESKKRKLNTNIIKLLDVQNNNAVGEVSVDKNGDINIILALNNKCYVKSKVESDISVSDDMSMCSSYMLIPEYDIPPDSCFETEDNDDGTVAIINYLCGDRISNILIPKEMNDKMIFNLQFEYASDGQYTNIEIPSTIEGKTVTSIYCMSPFEAGFDAVGLPIGIKSVVIPDTVTYIRQNAFTFNELENVTLPNSLECINDLTFFGNKLTSIVLPESLVNIGELGLANNLLSSINLPSSLEYIGSAAFVKNKLTSINIPNTLLYIDDGVFNNNFLPDNQAFTYYREDINDDGIITNDEIDTSLIIGYGGANIDNVVIPNGIKTIGNGAFSMCNIKSVEFPNSLTSIMVSAFSNNQLTNVALPSSIIEIDDVAFAYNLLESVTFSEGLTSIGEQAFYNNRLSSISIPSSVTHIERNSFQENPTLTSIYVNNSEGSLAAAPWGAENAVVSYDNFGTTLGYIRTDGNQYIDTGIKADNNTSIEMSIMLNRIDKTQTLFCSRNDYSLNTFDGFNIETGNFRYDYNTINYDLITSEINTKYKIYANKNKFYINDNLIQTAPEATFSSSGNLYLLASYKIPYNVIENYAYYNVYYVRIWQGDNLVRNMVPKKNNEGVVGMYDTVEKKFYPSQGTNAFLEPIINKE